MIKNGIHRLCLLMFFQFLVFTVFSQQILFVEAKVPTSSSVREIADKINKSLKTELAKQMPQYWKMEKAYSEWVFNKKKASFLKDNGITYVLQLRPFTDLKNITKELEIGFDFYFVDESYNIQPVIWENSDFILKIKGNIPSNAKLIAEKVKDEVLYYLGPDDPDSRSFRPRVKISTFDVPAQGIEYIDPFSFKQWLGSNLESVTAEKPLFVFYNPEMSKLYPEETDYIISGRFVSNNVLTDNLVRIVIMVDLPNNKKQINKIVNISNDYKPQDQTNIVQEIVKVLEENE